jgi:mannose-1-phosphate guanylyltransferase
MAARAAAGDAIVTRGIAPTRPATGYGYLRLGPRVAGRASLPVHRVLRYVEKPSLARATRMAADGRHLWNGGTFAFRPEVFLSEARRVLPKVALPLERAFRDYGTRRFAAGLARAYGRIPAISVDFGVMEKAGAVEVVAADLAWDDLGSWDAVARHRRPDARGNRVRGSATLVGARDCLVDAGSGHVALLGVEDVVVVTTDDAVLVARRGLGERVRDVVARLRAEGRGDLLA